ncbi:MAG: hypothetical protein ACE5GH_03235, partial [Fidelibacterota bacterium]
ADRWRKLMASSTGRDITSEVLPALRTYFEETGIAQGAKKQVSQLISRSRSKLERFDPVDRRELEEFVEMLMARKN